MFKHKSSLTIHLRCFHETLSSPDVDELLHFAIALLNFSFKKGVHSNAGLEGILSKTLILIWWSWAELNDW